MTQPRHRYWAFISYSHQDKAWGDWLHKRLETYRVPRRLVGKPHWSGTIPRRLFPIFRDRDELPSSADLGGVLNEALRQSRYQIIICSPRAAQSRWVNEEIKHFKSLGRENQLLAFIVDGEPRVGSERECFPPALRFKSDAAGNLTDARTEIVAADARKGRDGRDGAVLKLIAGLLGVSYDDLKQRERQRHLWRNVQWAAVGIATFLAAFGGWRWFEQYKEAQALEAHIEKVYDLGRRELLEHHEARAAVYLNEAYRLGRDTPALRFMLGQAMQAIDPLEDIRIDTGGPVRRPAFAPDSKSFITPTETKDGVIAQIWETATGKQLALLKDLPKVPLVTRFLPDGKKVLVSGFTEEQLDQTRGTGAFTGIWDKTSGVRIARFDGHSGRFGQPLDAQGRWLVTADVADAPSAHIWDLNKGTLARTVVAGAPVLAASISPDGRYVLTGDATGATQLWDRASGRPAIRLSGTVTGHIVGLLFSSDGKRALAFGARGDVRVWQIDTGHLELAFAADSAGFNDAALDDQHGRLLTIGTEGYKVWDIERGLLQLSRARDLINWSNAALSTDASLLVTIDATQSTAEVMHLASRNTLLTLERTGIVHAAAFSLDGQHLLLAHGQGQVELWRLPMRLLQQFVHPQRQGKFSSLYATRFDPAEQRVLTASYDGTLRLWNVASGEETQRIDEASPLIDAAFSPDGHQLASLTIDGHLRLRESVTLQEIFIRALGPIWAADPILFSPDSRAVVTLPDAAQPASKDLKVWGTGDREPLTLRLGCLPSAAAFSLHAPVLLTGCLDGSVQQWGITGGEQLRRDETQSGRVWRIAENPSRPLFATAQVGDSNIRLWGIGAKDLPVLRLPPSQFPQAIAFSLDGDTLGIGSSSGGVFVAGLGSHTIKSLGAHTKEVQGVRFLENGLLLTWRADSTGEALGSTERRVAGQRSAARFSCLVGRHRPPRLTPAHWGLRRGCLDLGHRAGAPQRCGYPTASGMRLALAPPARVAGARRYERQRVPATSRNATLGRGAGLTLGALLLPAGRSRRATQSLLERTYRLVERLA